ncbi:hypothetical protein LTR66_002689 [Elasticomyces elasticus]|nr:hypothetical protein LTR66_002689 [Elasticomyces elasticus]
MSHSTNLRTWQCTVDDCDYVVSTGPEHLSLDFINNAFATQEMYWAKPLSTDDMQQMLSNSLTLGLYVVAPRVPPASNASSPSSPRTPSPTLEDVNAQDLQQIGLARFITDNVTTAYLTDVFVAPDYRGKQLGKWLIACCREVIEGMPHLRRALLMASPGQGKLFYERELGMKDIEVERHHVVCMSWRKYA